MPTITIEWSWEEAFDKFGFDDGDGLVMTGAVIAALADAGYACHAETWGMHNYVIDEVIDADGNNVIPDVAEVGYDNPRRYLPAAVVELLDKAFPD